MAKKYYEMSDNELRSRRARARVELKRCIPGTPHFKDKKRELSNICGEIMRRRSLEDWYEN